MNTNDTNSAAQRLVEAETRLAQAVQRLRALQCAALYGNYDAAEFDRAVLAYREARTAAFTARSAWARSHQGQPPGSGDAAAAATQTLVVEPAPAGIEVTPRLRFVRWLVQTGRLSDWAVAEPAGFHAQPPASLAYSPLALSGATDLRPDASRRSARHARM